MLCLHQPLPVQWCVEFHLKGIKILRTTELNPSNAGASSLCEKVEIKGPGKPAHPERVLQGQVERNKEIALIGVIDYK